MANHAPAGHPVDHVSSHAEHAGPGPRTYINIFIVLFVMTAIEVAASYLTDIGVPQWGEIVVLVLLAVLKGLLVVMFYMHLRFDSRWFTMLFTGGMVLATLCIVAFLTLFSYHRSIVGPG